MSQPGLRTLRGPVHILGVPLDIGQTVRGTDVGPAAIRYAGLLRRVRELGINAEDLGNLEVPLSSAVDASQIVATIAEVCERLRDRVEASVRSGAVAITLGGDHSVAIGSVAGTLRAAPAGLLWIDAHGDFNTPETSPSGNVHGMPLAVLLGHGDSRLLRVCEGIGLEPHQVALVGIRQLDAREREHLGKAGVHVFTMRDIDERGMGTVAHEAIERVSSAGRVHVSLDIDVLECPDCGGRLRFVAAILLSSAIRGILRHLGLPSDPVQLAPARAPPERDDAWAC